jgi:hypothetical protein
VIYALDWTPATLKALDHEVRPMELTPGRLKAALSAGKIPTTDKALTILRIGLITIARGYHVEKVISGMAKSDTELQKDLLQLQAACRTLIDVFADDLRGTGQIEAILSDPWHGSRILRLVEELRSLSPKIKMALLMATQDGTTKRRRQNPETWFFLAVHDLFSEITGEEPGIAGPLHRFTKNCAALIDETITVPKNENSFHKRLTAALARRTGKIRVVPKIIFPGK